ncbi:hypothetical protein M8009_18330 [Halomonas sp. ATCH28]|uniref:Uncharacterized protein n=1 Tax=Halomonas gemina TaxID=2945105 RepID=A0ABT0T5P9_9GAMM|nr:hypothetical protein [Halomonas gemina]MCL7942240.1 hypothetical protein [Halomonas gemina]
MTNIPDYIQTHVQTAIMIDSGYRGVVPHQTKFLSVHHDTEGAPRYMGPFPTFGEAEKNFLTYTSAALMEAATAWYQDPECVIELADYLLGVGDELFEELFDKYLSEEAPF